jgi:hypothetical protein
MGMYASVRGWLELSHQQRERRSRQLLRLLTGRRWRPPSARASRPGCGDLYWLYGILSQSVHPSVSTSNAYIDPESCALRLTPRLGYPASVQMIAHCLIWAQRDLDKILPDLARAQGLEKLASAIGAVPELPGHQPRLRPRRGPGAAPPSGVGGPAD